LERNALISFSVFQSLVLLLKSGSDVHARDVAGNTALHHCMGDKDKSNLPLYIAQLLISAYGADVNARNRAGRTPLFDAVLNENTVLANLLLVNGARDEVNQF
jgi:ankyrin repeat protein